MMVPLADGESEEEELLPSRRASIRFGLVLSPFYIYSFVSLVLFVLLVSKETIHASFVSTLLYFSLLFLIDLNPFQMDFNILFLTSLRFRAPRHV